MEKKIIILKKDIEFELEKIKEVKRIDIHDNRIEIVFEVKNG